MAQCWGLDCSVEIEPANSVVEHKRGGNAAVEGERICCGHAFHRPRRLGLALSNLPSNASVFKVHPS